MARKYLVQRTFRVPNRLNASQREELAQAIIQEIFERTQRGIDKDGKPFKSYTKQYVESLDFRNAGKSRSNVNLTMTGDMLGGLELVSHSAGLITIGYKDIASETANKAEGNIIGSYGKKLPNAENARNFLGLPDDVVRRLAVSISSDTTSRNVRENQNFLGSVIDQIAFDLASGEDEN